MRQERSLPRQIPSRLDGRRAYPAGPASGKWKGTEKEIAELSNLPESCQGEEVGDSISLQLVKFRAGESDPVKPADHCCGQNTP